MADRADPTAVKALTPFVENRKALLDLTEEESREGKQHFEGPDKCT